MVGAANGATHQAHRPHADSRAKQARGQVTSLMRVACGDVGEAHAHLSVMVQEVTDLEQFLTDLVERPLRTCGIQDAEDAQYFECVIDVSGATPVVGDDKVDDAARRRRNVRTEGTRNESPLILDGARRVGQRTRETSILLKQVGQAEEVLGDPHRVGARGGEGRRQVGREGD